MSMHICAFAVSHVPPAAHALQHDGLLHEDEPPPIVKTQLLHEPSMLIDILF